MAHRNDLVDHHSHRVIAGVRVPVETRTVSGLAAIRQTHSGSTSYRVLKRAGVAAAVALQVQPTEAGCLYDARAGSRSCTRHNACVPRGRSGRVDRLAGPAERLRWRRDIAERAPSTASRMRLPWHTVIDELKPPARIAAGSTETCCQDPPAGQPIRLTCHLISEQPGSGRWLRRALKDVLSRSGRLRGSRRSRNRWRRRRASSRSAAV